MENPHLSNPSFGMMMTYLQVAVSVETEQVISPMFPGILFKKQCYDIVHDTETMPKMLTALFKMLYEFSQVEAEVQDISLRTLTVPKINIHQKLIAYIDQSDQIHSSVDSFRDQLNIFIHFLENNTIPITRLNITYLINIIMYLHQNEFDKVYDALKSIEVSIASVHAACGESYYVPFIYYEEQDDKLYSSLTYLKSMLLQDLGFRDMNSFLRYISFRQMGRR